MPPTSSDNVGLVRMLSFNVFGVPQPKGSMRAFMSGSKIVVTSANTKLKGWERAVKDVAKIAMDGDAHMTGRCPGLVVDMAFRMPGASTSKPDLDKLIRGVLDAMTGVVYKDDCMVTCVMARKLEEYDGEPGVRVEVWG